MIISSKILAELEAAMSRKWFTAQYVPDMSETLDAIEEDASLHLDTNVIHPALPKDTNNIYLLDLALNTSSLSVSGDRGVQALTKTAPILFPRALLTLLEEQSSPVHEALPTFLTFSNLDLLFGKAKRQTIRESKAARSHSAFDRV